MPRGLQRFYGANYLHFITSSCYQRRALLSDPKRRDLFLETLEQTRLAYRFTVVGYVVMPEHFHLLMGEPERADPSVVMQVVKQRFAQNLIERWRSDHMGKAWPWQDARDESHVWQRRFYDFVVWTQHKRAEKLDYMHRNPVRRGLVKEPGAWRWTSFRHYEYAEPGPVLVNDQIPVELRITQPRTWGTN